MSLPLLSLIGWSVVPDFLSRQLLSFLQRAGVLRATPNPIALRRQYAAIFAAVVLSYLSYNLVESARTMSPNFYQTLNVQPDVDDAGLKTAFRLFARHHHPDRPGIGKDGEAIFIAVRDAYNALKDPVVRFAYDRFGPDVLLWSKTCSTTREYIHQGLLHSSGYHLFVASALVFWSFVGSSNSTDPVAFWRHLLYVTLFFAELSLILAPSQPPRAPISAPKGLATTYTTRTLLHVLFPHRTIHQHILFLHQLFLFLSVALSRVVPVLLAAFGSPPTSMELNQEIVKNIAQLAAMADRESSVAVHTLMHSITSPPLSPFSQPIPHEDISSLARPRPFQVPPELSSLLSSTPSSAPLPEMLCDPFRALIREMEALVIEANVKKDDGPLRSAWEAALGRAKRLWLRPPFDDRPESGPRLSFRRERSLSL